MNNWHVRKLRCEPSRPSYQLEAWHLPEWAEACWGEHESQKLTGRQRPPGSCSGRVVFPRVRCRTVNIIWWWLSCKPIFVFLEPDLVALRKLKLTVEISSTPLQCFSLERAILKFISRDPVDRLLAAPQAGDFNITASLFYLVFPSPLCQQEQPFHTFQALEGSMGESLF